VDLHIRGVDPAIVSNRPSMTRKRQDPRRIVDAEIPTTLNPNMVIHTAPQHSALSSRKTIVYAHLLQVTDDSPGSVDGTPVVVTTTETEMTAGACTLYMRGVEIYA
jgi:hypothetical protein